MFASDGHKSCSTAPSYCESYFRRAIRRSVIHSFRSTRILDGLALLDRTSDACRCVCLTWCPEELADPDDSEQPDSTAAEPLEGPPGPRRCSHSSAGRISTRTHARTHAHTCCALIHTYVCRKKKTKHTPPNTPQAKAATCLSSCVQGGGAKKFQSYAGSVPQPRDPDSELGRFAPRNLRVKHSEPAPGTGLCRHVRSLKGRERIPQ